MATTTNTKSVYTPTPADLANITAEVQGTNVVIHLGEFGQTLNISFDWDGEECYHDDLTFEEEPDGTAHHWCERCGESFDSPDDAESHDDREPRFYVHVEHWGCNLSHHRKV